MMLLVVLAIAVSGAAAHNGNGKGLRIQNETSVDLRPYNVTAGNMYASQDKNNVGYFTLDQFKTINTAAYDFNHDHVIERHEYVCYVSAEDPKLQSFAHALFDEYDSNHNHRIEPADFEAFFKRMDGNGDGHVTKAEFISFAVPILEKTQGFTLHGHHHALHGDHYCTDHGQHHQG